MPNENQISTSLKDTLFSMIDKRIEDIAIKYIENRLKNWKIPGSQIKANSIPSTGIKDGALLNGKYFEIQASIIKAFVLEAISINAKLITSGQLDTSKVTIQSGENTRFVLNGDGLFAYFEPEAGVVDETTYIVHDQNGIRYVKENVTLRSESWDGTRFFELVDGVAVETLIFTNTGKAWLKGDLTVGDNDSPEGAIKISGGGHYVGTTKYSSGALGSGWRINGDGSATFNNIRARGKLTAATFEYESISSVGGSLFVSASLNPISNSPITVVDVSGVNHYSVALNFPFSGENHFAAGQEWDINDILSIQGIVELTTGVYEVRDFRCKISAFTETGCTLQSVEPIAEIIAYDEETGAPFDAGEITLTGGSITPNSAFIFIGSVGTEGQILRRGILLSASDTNGPFIDVYDSTENNTMPVLRIGKLDGISDPSLRVQPSGHGGYFRNGFFTGHIYSNYGNIGGFNIDAHTLSTIDGKNGIGDGNAASPAGQYIIWAGNAIVSEALFRLDKDGRLHVGSDSGNHIFFDGENIDIQVRSLTVETEDGTLSIGDAVGSLQNDIGTLNGANDALQAVVRIRDDGVHVGQSDYLSETVMSPDGLHIKDNTGTECVAVTDNKTTIKNAQIVGTCQMAGFAWVTYPSGRLSLKKSN